MTTLAAESALKPSKKERTHTFEEYLYLEETSLVNHEYDNGKIISMAGGSPQHSEIKASVIMSLGLLARQSAKKCRIYNSDIRIFLPVYDRAVMPDAAVVVGEPQFSVEVPLGVLLNPTLIIEVFSNSSESYDRGEKFARYRTLPALEEYVLIAQDMPRVETFIKQDGKWLIHETAEGLASEVAFVSIGATIPLQEIYYNVTFEKEKAKRRGKKG